MQPISLSGGAGALRLQKRLALCLCCFVPLLCLSLAPAAGLPLPASPRAPGALGCGLAQLALTLPVFWLCRDEFLACRAALHTAHTLSAEAPACLGAGTALLCGTAALFLPGAAEPYPCGFWFDAAAGVLTVVTAGRLLQLRLTRRAAPALQPPPPAPLPAAVCVLRQGSAVTVPLQELCPGDLFLVRPGETIPADGVVTEGVSTVCEAALTGAADPADKFPGSPVSAATVNRNGALTCRAVRVGQHTTLARAASLRADALANAQTARPALSARQQRLLSCFVPAVVVLAALTLAVWLLLGRGFGFAAARAVAVLAAACPAALLLAAPAAVRQGLAAAANHGLLFRSAADLQSAAALHTVLLDKTGAVTTGEPTVVQIVGTRKVPAKFLLGMAAGLELRSDHPLARAILKKAEEEKIAYSRLTAFEAVPGRGLLGKLAGKELAGGSRAFIEERCALTPDLLEAAEAMERNGVTPVFFSLAGHPAGVIGVSEVVRSTCRGAVADLQALGVQVRLLTAEPPAAAAHVLDLLGLDRDCLLAEIPPQGKPDAVRRLQTEGPVALAGSAARDAAALACADLGVAVGVDETGLPDTGLVLLRGDLTGLPEAVRLSRAAAGCVRHIVGGVLAYHAAALLLAAGVLAPLGVLPGPVLCALAAVLCALCAGAAALRPAAPEPPAAPTPPTPPR